MGRLTDLGFRLRTLLRLGAAEREMDEEFAFHVDMETRRLVARGLEPAEAAERARRLFGGETRERQRARDEWGIGPIRDLASDLRHALRQFRRRPGFTLLGVLTLGLGIGATVALFSVVRGVLLQPLPVRDEARLQVFWFPFSWRGVEFDYVRERVPRFESLAAYSADGFTFETGDGAALIPAVESSAELFEVLGAAPLMGRGFAPGEDRPGAERVVVVSWGFWQSELGGDPGVLGRQIRLGGQATTVIGVMPRRFYFPTPEFRLWRPLLLDPASGLYQGSGYLALIGRVRAGVTRAELDGEMDALGRALGERFTYPAAWDKTKDPSVTSLRESTVGDARPALLLLLGAVGLLLLVATANVAALVLARTTDRSSEMTLRAALGAGRGRLVRQIVAESLALSAVAGLLGAGIAALGFGALVVALPLGNGLGRALALDWSMLLVAVGLAVTVGLLVAAAPVRDLLKGRLHGVSGDRSGFGVRPGLRRLHGGLVAGEVALAVLLLAGSMLFVRSVARLYAVDPGFAVAGVLSFDLVHAVPSRPAERVQLYTDVLEAVGRLPGVLEAGLVSQLPIRDGGFQGPVEIEDRAELQGAAAPNSVFRPVTPGLFAALGIRIVRGRGFAEMDREDAVHVGIVSESFAARAWPGEDPIGRRVRTRVAGDSTWIDVVGVAEETRMFTMTGENPLALYVPIRQLPWTPSPRLVVKASGDLAELPAAVRAVARQRDSRLAVARVTTMEDVVASAMAEPLRLRFFLSVFGVLALGLGTVGVYGVVSYAVSRRRTEFGVRMALGASPARVVREVVRGGVAPVAIGIGFGLALAAMLSSLVAGFLYGVTPTDPVSLAVAAAVLLGAGALAAALPGWRAGRTSPVEALRAE
jgi:predicted permease